MLDIDFLCCEYDSSVPRGLVEFKHQLAAEVKAIHPSMQALRLLADASNIPLFVARYADDFKWWDIEALNGRAIEYLPARRETITNRAWITLLYKVRDRELPRDFFRELSSPG